MVDKTETKGADNRSHAFGGPLEDLRAFCGVVELGSISAAARELGETKGGISRRVSRLERRLGTALLARTPRAVTPTEEGVAFHVRAREALSLLEDAAEDASGARTDPQGHLRVTAPIDLGVDLLPRMITRFRAQYPRITVELLLASEALDLAAHRIDVALRASSTGLPDMEYRAAPLADFDVCLYATPDYLKHHRFPEQPADLAGHDLIVPRDVIGGNSVTLTSRRGRKEQVAIRPGIETRELASATRFVQSGGGIGPMPEIVAAPSVSGGQLQRVLPEWHLLRARLHAITLGGREAPARVRLFRDFIRAELAELGADGVAAN